MKDYSIADQLQLAGFGEEAGDDAMLNFSVHEAQALQGETAAETDSQDNNLQQRGHTPSLHTLTFDNVDYSVHKRAWGCRRKTSTHILHGVYGAVESGRCLAIMGPSGSGKSTLLDILSFRKYEGETTGQILFDGETRTKFFKRYIGYVTQRDALIASLTVRETLLFASRLRLDRSVTKQERERRVDSLIEELGLTHRASTKVGGHRQRGLSGGEMKRVSIGVELICDPDLIFLDEPTSGLDATSAQEVMELLTRLTRGPQGKGIVYTIHQPRSNIVKLFDRLLLLSRGHIVYYGQATGARAFLEPISFACEPDTNPADYYLDVVNADVPTVIRYSEAFKKTAAFGEIRSLLDVHESHGNGHNAKLEYAQPNYRQVMILFQRECLATIRNPSLFWSLVLQAVVFGVFIGSLWQGITSNRAVAEVNALFFASSLLSMVAWSVCPHLIDFRHVYDHERASGMYRAKSYVLAKTLHDVPLLNIHTLIYVTLMFWLVGLDWSTYPFYLAISLSYSFACVSIVTFGAAIAKDVDIAILIVTVINGIATVFSGYFLPLYNLPSFVKWLYYASYQQHALSAYVINNFEHCDTSLICASGLQNLQTDEVIEKTCATIGNYTHNFTQLPNPNTGIIPIPGGSPYTPDDALAAVGVACSSDVLESEGCTTVLLQVFGGDRACDLPSKWTNLGVVLAVAFAFRFATFLAFRLRKFFLKTFT